MIFMNMKNNHNSSTHEGYHSLTPALVIKGAKRALDFYQRALGASVVHSMDGPDGSVMHAEMTVGDSRFMFSDEFPDWGVVSPETLGGTPVSLYLYVADADAAFAQAVREGAKELRPVTTEFWGDRMGQFLDPFGHKWTVATRVENVSDEETRRRGEEWVKENSAETA